MSDNHMVTSDPCFHAGMAGDCATDRCPIYAANDCADTPREPEPPAPPIVGDVHIYSGEHGMFWLSDRQGYTMLRRFAGRYTNEEADSILASAGPEKRLIKLDWDKSFRPT